MTLSPTPDFDFPPGRLAQRRDHLVREIAVSARPRRARPWRVAIALGLLVVAAGVVANVALGLGIGGRIEEFVAGTPAPPPIEERLRDEVLAERIVPLFGNESVEFTGPAHGVLAIETTGGAAALWTVPTASETSPSPVCYLVEFVRLSERAGRPLGDSRCIRRPFPTEGLSWARTKQEVDGRIIAVVAGVVAPNVVSTILRSADGAESQITLEGGFFLAELRDPDANYDLLAFDSNGSMTATAQITWFSAGLQDIRNIKPTGPPRTIIETRDSIGRPLRLTLRPAEDGNACLASGPGMTCGPESGLRAEKGISVGPSLTAKVFTLQGSVGPEIGTLELLYEDGTTERLPIVERFVLFGVKPERFEEGRRPVVLVGRDDAGRVVAERPLSPELFAPDSPIWLDKLISP